MVILDRRSGEGTPVELARARSPLSPRERALVALEFFLAACGLGGGLYMTIHPLTMIPLRYLQGTWFHTWRWPGLALLFFIGVCPAMVATVTVLRLPVAVIGHVCVGLGLVVWILVQVGWIVVSPALQVSMGLLGVAILALGLSELRVRSACRLVRER